MIYNQNKINGNSKNLLIASRAHTNSIGCKKEVLNKLKKFLNKFW